MKWWIRVVSRDFVIKRLSNDEYQINKLRLINNFQTLVPLIRYRIYQMYTLIY